MSPQIPITPTRPVIQSKPYSSSSSQAGASSSPAPRRVSAAPTCNAAQDLMDRAQSILKQAEEAESPRILAQRQQQVKPLFQYALCLQEETTGGLFYNEGTARIYYSIAWYHYEHLNDYSAALTYFLQCLRISFELYGEEHVNTQIILDDIRDLLEEDLQLDSADYLNPVFESWALQDDAADLRTNNKKQWSDDDDCRDDDEIREEEELLQEALTLLPWELDLERAAVYIMLAELAERQSQAELALSYYCQALMIMPQWLTNSHPRVNTVKKQSHQVVASLTPVMMMPAARIGARRTSSSSSSSSSCWVNKLVPPPSRESLSREQSLSKNIPASNE